VNRRDLAGELATKVVDPGGYAAGGVAVSLASGFDVTPVPTDSPGELLVDHEKELLMFPNTRKYVPGGSVSPEVRVTTVPVPLHKAVTPETVPVAIWLDAEVVPVPILFVRYQVADAAVPLMLHKVAVTVTAE
jgi:hypothetical protein